MIQILFLFCVNIAMYYRTLKFAYANDDWELAKCGCKEPKIVDAKDGRGEIFKMCSECGLKQRPECKSLWRKISMHFFGIAYWDPKLAHAMTLMIHCFNTTLIYLAFGRNEISFFTALLFAIHPVATQGSSVWLSGRNYGTATTIALLMRLIPIATPLLYLAAFRFALIGAPGPAMFIRSPWWFWILLIPIVMWSMKKTVRQSTEMKYILVSKTRKPFAWANVILFFKTIGYYFCICLFPTHLGVHHTYLERYGLTKEETAYALKKDGFLYLGIALVSLEISLFVFFWGNPAVYGLTWFFIFMLPWSNICTIHQAVTERYIVLSLIGLMYALVNVLSYTGYLIPAVLLFSGYYACRTQMYLRLYRDILTCTHENTHNFEDSAAAWRWRGGLERNLGLTQEAFQSWMMAWRLRPHDFVLNNNIAAILAGQGRYEEAQKFMDLAKQAPLPTKELKDKWEARQKAFQDELDRGKMRRDQLFKVGRNEKCPCGSGKKYKKCCGRLSH